MFLAALLAAAALAPGEVTEKISCRDKPGQSYALSLPSAYTPEKLWPVLYMLDARGRALLPIERFRAAAEEFGWILVSSYNSRSDTKEDPNLPALQAMWNDTHERLALDPRRAYATGFSGGARAAVAMALFAPKLFAGVIGCGAGFADESAPAKDVPFLYFGTVGDRDSTCGCPLDETLAAAGAVSHRDLRRARLAPPPSPQAVAGWRSGRCDRRAPEGRRAHRRAPRRALVGRGTGGRGRSAEAATGGARRKTWGLADVSGRAKAAALRKSDAVRHRRRGARGRAGWAALDARYETASRGERRGTAGADLLAAGRDPAPQSARSDASPERLSAGAFSRTFASDVLLPPAGGRRQRLTRARLLLSWPQKSIRKPYPDYSLAAAATLRRHGPRDPDLQRSRRASRFELLDEDPDFARVRADPAFQKWLSGARGSG
jgi:predicted esterase